MKSLITISLLVVAAASQANIIWDNTGASNGTSNRGPGDAPGLRITNTNAFDVALTRVSFEGRNHSTQDFRFFLADSAGAILNSLVVGVAATGSDTMIGTDVNWTLMAGQTYTIAAISSTDNADYNYAAPVPGTTQNGLVGLQNSNWSGFATPGMGGNGGAEMSWQLESVPEPATMAVLGLGALVAARRRRSK